MNMDKAEILSTALELLIVGMLSVFFILGIVVGLGRLLVFIVNKYSPEVKPTTRMANRNISPQAMSQSISGSKMAVLSAVVDLVTESKGVLKSVEKL